MKIIEIKTDTKLSKILIGEKIANLKQYLPPVKTVIVTDKTVSAHYHSFFNGFNVVEIGEGEENKTLETLQYIFSRFVELEVDRSTFIVAFGGGIVCDVAGFAASVFMRGLRFGFVSTTLLSQVDASVGGKNGVNFHRYKNMIGVFNQPEFVICDSDVLKTLERKEFIAGFAEIVKAAVIKDYKLFQYLEGHWQQALDLDEEVIGHLVYESVLIKSKVVEADEREKGERRLLNFGHTFAHSFEKLTDLLHGEAVSIGMVLAAKLSEKLGFLSRKEYQRIYTLLGNFGLPVDISLDIKKVLSAMKQDKKREGDSIHLVLIKQIGEAFSYKTKLNKLEEIIHDLHSDIG
ncbi:MAG: 3-dehydroquinate synthase [Bacteroidales bacterium]|nr:3-dehydroquinate synthase [Bacteroidales bacterium]